MIELKDKRDHYSKYFDNGDGTFTCRQSSGILHYFDGEDFKDVVEIPFPEGKEIQSETDLEMIDIPSWAEVELSEDKKEVWFKDKKGVRIHRFGEAFVCDIDINPHSVVDKDSNYTELKSDDLLDKKYNLDREEKIILDETKITKVNFCVNNNKLAFELPAGVEAKDLKAFDDTNTSSTNNADNYLDSANPNTNLESDQLDTYGGSNNSPMLRFTLASGSGTISNIKLFLYKRNRFDSGSGATMNAYQILRDDWHETQSTWNIYKTGSNWSTAGCLGDGTDYSSTVIDAISPDSASDTWDSWIITGTGGTGTPISLTWGDIMNIKLKGSSANTKINSRYNSRTYATSTYRPYVEITYSAGSPSSSPSSSPSASISSSPSASVSSSPSSSPSASESSSPSTSISSSPSESPSASESSSPSASESSSPSASPSASESSSPSTSASPSSSESSSPSASPSTSESSSPSSSQSPSSSPSTSESSSPSASISSSPSESPSASESSSPSASISGSPSESPSTSISSSPSTSISGSPSSSPSASISGSPSTSISGSPSASPSGLWINETKHTATWVNKNKLT